MRKKFYITYFIFRTREEDCKEIKREIVINMLKKSLEIHSISEMTKLDIEEIEKCNINRILVVFKTRK